MSVKIDVIPFQPNLECRYFTELTLLKFWKYDFDKIDLLGLSGGFCFAYTTIFTGKNNFFSIFGRRPKLLQKICVFLNGEYFEDYNSTIDSLHYLTEHIGIPVIVKVDFNKFKDYYSLPIRTFIRINIEKLSKFNVIDNFPHDVIVVGCDDNKVICFDNLTKTELLIPTDEFFPLWEVSCYEYGGAKKRYLEYISVPYIDNFKKYSLLPYSLQLVANSFFTIYPNDGCKETIFLLGEQGLNQFRKDLQEDKFTRNAYSFSIEMMYELNKNFWKGLERGSFAIFLERIYKNSKHFIYKKEYLEKTITTCHNLSHKWLKFFYDARKFRKEKVLQCVNELIKLEKEVFYLLSELVKW